MKRLIQIIMILIMMSVLVNSGFATVITSSGTVSGTVNGTAISGSLSGTGNTDTGFLSGDISGLDDAEIAALIEINSLLSWKCRGTANATASALNLWDLTGGNYSIFSTVSFGSGETLILDTTVTNPSSDTLEATVQLSGTAPLFNPSDVVLIGNYTETWTQTTATTIAMSALGRTFTVNGSTYGYDWTSVVTYDGVTPLPFDQVRNAWNINVNYDSTLDTLHFDLYNSVVPEPATMILLGVGALFLRRKK